MISKTKINERMKNKRNPILTESIFIAKKHNNLELAKKLSYPTRKQLSVNLNELNNIKEDKIIIVGKILGGGDIKKKMTIAALGYSTQAREKLAKAGCETKTIHEEIKKNPKLTGYKLI
jgi:large subunit ribosomal protein L18e